MQKELDEKPSNHSLREVKQGEAASLRIRG